MRILDGGQKNKSEQKSSGDKFNGEMCKDEL